MVSAQRTQEENLSLIKKISLLGTVEILFVSVLLIGGLLVCVAAARQLSAERKEGFSLDQRIKGRRGPGGSIAKVGVKRREEEREKVEEGEEEAREKRASPVTEEDKEESTTAARFGEEQEEGAEEEFEDLEEFFEEEEEALPPDFYLKQEEKEKEVGPRISKIGKPSVAPTPPAEKIDFSVHPIPRRVYHSPHPVSGNKRAFTSIWLNDKKIIPEDKKVTWNLKVDLKEGVNSLVFSSQDVYGDELAQTRVEVFYEPPLPEEPKISSLPTFFASPSAESLLNPKLAPLLKPKREPLYRAVNPTGSPRVYSPTHPNPNRWYRNNSPKFVWEENTFWKSFLVSLGRLPIDPTEDVGEKTRISYQNLEDGVWFFGVKAITWEGQETVANFHRILIDHTPPKIKDLKIVDPYPTYKNGSLVSLEVVWEDSMFDSMYREEDVPFVPPLPFLKASEKKKLLPHLEDIAPLRRYIGGDFSAVDTNFSQENLIISSPVKLKEGVFKATLSYRVSLRNVRADEGAAPVSIKVADHAGNSVTSQLNITLANSVPITLKVEEKKATELLLAETVKSEGLRLSGTTVPNVDVTLFIYSEPFVVTLRSDLAGNWEYTLREPLSPGNHVIYAMAQDRQGNSTPVVQIGAVTILNSAQAAEIDRLVNTVSKIPSREKIVTRAEAAREAKVTAETPRESLVPRIITAQMMMAVGLALFVGGIASLAAFLKKKTV